MLSSDEKLLKNFLLEWGKVRGKSELTIKNYTIYINEFKRFWNGEKRSMLDMKREDFVNYIYHLQDKKNTAATIYNKLMILSTFFGYLEDIQTIDHKQNPYAMYRIKKIIPKGKSKKREFLEPEEFRKYVKCCYETKYPERNKMILLLMVSPGGPRRKEVIGIKVKDIDIETRKIKLVNRKRIFKDARATSRKIPVGPKLNKERFIRATPVAIDNIENHILKNNLKPEDWLTKFSNMGLYQLFVKLSQIAKRKYKIKKNITPHSLRATSAIYCLRAKVPELIIMKLFGWAKRDMIDVYVTLDERDIDREIDLIFSTAKGDNDINKDSYGGL